MIENSNGSMYMPVAPAYGGNDMFNGNGLWFLLIWMAMFGWGGNGFGFGGNNGYSEVQRGFDQSSVMNGIQGIQNTLSNGFAQAEIAANSRQMADMNQYFQMQNSFQNCCCENRLATVGLNNTVIQEGAATRAASANDRQMIMDKLCQLEMDGIKQNYENRIASMQNTIDALRDANNIARTTAQFNALGDRMQASQDLQTNALEQYLAPVPKPSYIVQNPNCCGTQTCNCGSM